MGAYVLPNFSKILSCIPELSTLSIGDYSHMLWQILVPFAFAHVINSILLLPVTTPKTCTICIFSALILGTSTGASLFAFLILLALHRYKIIKLKKMKFRNLDIELASTKRRLNRSNSDSTLYTHPSPSAACMFNPPTRASTSITSTPSTSTPIGSTSTDAFLTPLPPHRYATIYQKHLVSHM